MSRLSRSSIAGLSMAIGVWRRNNVDPWTEAPPGLLGQEQKSSSRVSSVRVGRRHAWTERAGTARADREFDSNEPASSSHHG